MMAAMVFVLIALGIIRKRFRGVKHYPPKWGMNLFAKGSFRTVSLDMDLSEFKGKATYEQIKACVLEQTGLKAS